MCWEVLSFLPSFLPSVAPLQCGLSESAQSRGLSPHPPELVELKHPAGPCWMLEITAHIKADTHEPLPPRGWVHGASCTFTARNVPSSARRLQPRVQLDVDVSRLSSTKKRANPTVSCRHVLTSCSVAVDRFGVGSYYIFYYYYYPGISTLLLSAVVCQSVGPLCDQVGRFSAPQDGEGGRRRHCWLPVFSSQQHLLWNHQNTFALVIDLIITFICILFWSLNALFFFLRYLNFYFAPPRVSR